jgi:hypothetical protein
MGIPQSRIPWGGATGGLRHAGVAALGGMAEPAIAVFEAARAAAIPTLG